MRKDGKKLEQLVQIVEEIYSSNSSTKIFSNYKIENTSSNKREIDILIKSQVNNFDITIAIECKEYKNKIPVEKIEAFNSKCLRIPEINKKIFVSEKGFQKDAIDCAKNFGIELYTFNYLEENARKILFPIHQIKPKFKGFEVLQVYCDISPLLEDISISKIEKYYSVNKKDEFNLYQLVELGAKENWTQIMQIAFYQWMKTKSDKHKIHFVVNITGIFFEFENEKIFVNQIECNANIDFEFIDIISSEMEYKNFENDKTKANVLNFDFEKDLKAKIIVDEKENLHFFDTTNEKEIKKLDVLFGYDPKTDKFTDYRKKILVEYIDIETEKGRFRVMNLPNIEKIEQFGGQIMIKIIDEINEIPIPNPEEKCYLKLIGNMNEIDYQIVFDQIATFKFTDIDTKNFLDSFLNPHNKTIRKDIAENSSLKYKFYDNPYIAKIVCA